MTGRMAPFSMYQLFINIHTTCKDSPVTGLSVCPSGRGAFGSGLVATKKYTYSVSVHSIFLVFYF